jgi:O-acetyl-ADP-ribose deacetylase (regulator of RNase III)
VKLTLVNFQVVVGNLVDQSADAIVYPAHQRLLPGGGLSWNIFQKAGPGLEEELSSSSQRFCAEGDAISSGAHGLKARNLIHAVVPRYDLFFAGQPVRLANAYLMSIIEAGICNAKSIVFPNLGVGPLGWNSFVEASWARKGILAGLNSSVSVSEVTICCATEEDASIVRNVFQRELTHGHEVFASCPSCTGEGTPITYGIPLYGIGSFGGYVSGGCCVTLESPVWVCTFCSHEWA